MSHRTSLAFQRASMTQAPPVPAEQVVSGSFVKAVFHLECGGCGWRVIIETEDGAYEMPNGWSLFDLAVDSVRWGFERGSVQGNFILCANCTDTVDDNVPKTRSATESEVRAALNMPDGDN